MPRPSSLSPDNILRFLQVTGDSASANEIGAALHVGKAGRKPLFNMLMKLKKRGAIEELPGGRYRLAGRKGKEASEQRAAGGEGKTVLQQGASGGGDAGRGSPGQSSPGSSRQQGEPHSLARDEVRGRLVLHHDGYGF